MPFEEMLDDLAKRREKALKMGKPDVLKRMKDAGLLNARERLDYLLDKGSFVVAVVLGWLVLKEEFSWRVLAGAGLILAGVIVAATRK